MSDQQEFSVTWEIDLTSDGVIDAALDALRTHRDRDSIGTVFDVHTGNQVLRVDLGGDGAVDPDDYDYRRATVTPVIPKADAARITYVEGSGQVEYSLTWDGETVTGGGRNLNDGTIFPTRPVDNPERFGTTRTLDEFIGWVAAFNAAGSWQWTVTGYWEDGHPYPVAAVRGSHRMVVDDDCWAQPVEAQDATTAMKLATAAMLER